MCLCWKRSGRRIDRSLFHITSKSRDQADVGRHAWPLQQHHPERTRFRNERRRDCPLLVLPELGDFPWLDALTLGMTPVTRLSLSGQAASVVSCGLEN